MAAITSELPSGLRNRRRRVRHKIQTPAYASFTGESKSSMLDLYEILDISEEGVSIQCPEPIETDRHINLCLDLAECSDHVYTTGRVVWSNATGRVGLHFSELPPASLFRLREWLFLNAIAGVANAEVEMGEPRERVASGSVDQDTAVHDSLPHDPLAHDLAAHDPLPPVPSYTDTLAAVGAVQREVEALGADLPAALQLIAERAQTLVRASGAAIALATADPDIMDCRASAGQDAPPIGARLQVGSGFSGECVKTGMSLRCDDSELDERVDRESCRALGIRSILAVPIRVGDKSIGIVEVFAAEPDAFTDSDGKVLQRLAESVVAAVNRAARAENLPQLAAESAPTPYEPPPGSVLFASDRQQDEIATDQKGSEGFHLPRSLWILLICAAAICTALGYLSAPYLQAKLEKRGAGQIPTVLASSPKPDSATNFTPPADIESANLDQLRQLAENGDPAAENALGLRYFAGDAKAGLKPDEKDAAHWFTLAAEHGDVAAQSKLGFLYWSGNHGLPKDVSQAYFWANVALLHGGQNSEAISLSQSLAQTLRPGFTAEQAKVIERQARGWMEKHPQSPKPTAGH